MATRTGTRVRVHSGDGERLLGTGVLEDRAPVYIGITTHGVMVSHPDARTPIKSGDFDNLDHIETVFDNPVIRLDDGRLVYGCQVWWEPVE